MRTNGAGLRCILLLSTLGIAPTTLAAAGHPAARSPVPLLTESETVALAQEVSGASALRTVEGLSRLHRMRASAGYDAAADLVLAELARYGFADAAKLVLPADGEVFYGTQRSRPAWRVRFAELWEIDTEGRRIARLASWDEAPLGLAQDSQSASVAGAGLVDVGDGLLDRDYEGREIAGKIVLTSSQPGAVAAMAVGKYGAAGIVSWAQNQHQGWWGEDANLVRWGHLDTFAKVPTFAFMVSPARARALSARLAAGEAVLLAAEVDAGNEPGAYSIPTATIPGRDPALAAEEIVLSCHLDHPRPGANDNASGCAAILEVARTLSKLISEGRIERPRRTLRFVWPPEIEGTMALLVGRPELAERIRAAIHLDMVGGGPETKAVFHVTRGPASLPSFVHDLAAAQTAWVNRQTMGYAAIGESPFPLVAAGGGREPLRGETVELTRGSDHEVYGDSSFGVPAVYFNDWPDRWIHTDRDRPENLDPTKLQRAAFLAAAAGIALADLSDGDVPELWRIQRAAGLERLARLGERQAALERAEAENLARFASWQERAIFDSVKRFAKPSRAIDEQSARFFSSFDRLVGLPSTLAKRGGPVYARNAAHPGPVDTFGYSWLRDHLGLERVAGLALLHRDDARAAGPDYGYEALNLVNGRRTTLEIRDSLSAIYEPVPLAEVEEYLRALAEAGLVGEASR
ncbi:MAG: DUF4910 domain-containing protein [Thermoanaerobaculia bacterium]